MKKLFQSWAVAGAIGLSVAAPASADISALELKEALVSLYESAGYHVSIGSESTAGGALTLENLEMALDIPDGGGEITGTYAWVRMTEKDGGVEVTFAPSMSIVGKIDPDGEKVDIRGHIDMNDLRMMVSGERHDLKVASSMSSGELKLDSLNVDGKDIPMTVNMGFGAVTSNMTYTHDEEDYRALSGDSDVQDVKIAVDVQKPGGGGFFTMTARLASLDSHFEFEGTISDALETDPEQGLKDMLAAGFFVDATLDMGQAYLDVNFADRDDRFAATVEADGGLFGVTLSDEEIGYEISQQDVKVNFSTSELPFPSINFAYAENSFSFAVPLATGDGPQDFHVRTALRDFTISDAIWGIFDPGATIPRDPATFAIDISGKLLVLIDILSPENIDKLDDMDGPPMLPVSVDLNELLASFGGAVLDGKGSVAIDFSNPGMLFGFPAPSGEFDVSLKGAFGLMDKLQALGLIPPDASMGARAMIGAFAKPVGEDEFTSKIELGADGSIKANGQQIQ